MKRLDKVEYNTKKGVIIYENPNGKVVDVSTYNPQVIYENVPREQIKLL